MDGWGCRSIVIRSLPSCDITKGWSFHAFGVRQKQGGYKMISAQPERLAGSLMTDWELCHVTKGPPRQIQSKNEKKRWLIMTYWALSHSHWQAAAPSPRMFLSQTWDGWPKSTKVRLRKATIAFQQSPSARVCVFLQGSPLSAGTGSPLPDLWVSSGGCRWQTLPRPPPPCSSCPSAQRKTQTARWFRRRWCKKKRGTGQRVFRMKRSRRGAAGLVLALLDCIGVKLQQLILQVQLVVQLGHLQVTNRIAAVVLVFYMLWMSVKGEQIQLEMHWKHFLEFVVENAMKVSWNVVKAAGPVKI